jgi:type I restriction enzyme, S subunit
MNAWKPRKLDELGFVGRGKSRHRPRNAAFLYGGRYPFFQTGDIKAANFHLTEYKQTYSEEGLAQSKLWKPGTLCITIASNIAESAILGIEGCFPDSVVGFVADPDKADVRFVKYYMDTLKLQMQSVSRGTTQDNLSLDKLLSFDFRVPPLPVQRRIAGILSAYDELMENSQQRIRILEAMARALYREWFVHFRAPGMESNRRINSPLGPIPQGWEVKPLNDVVDDIVDYRGKTPTKLNGEWFDEGILALSALNVKGGRLVNLEKSRRVNEDLYSRWMKNPLRRSDILMTSEAPLGELFFLCKEERYCLSQRLFSIRANRRVIAPVILYLCMESEQTQHELRSRASGATVSGIRQSELRNIPVVVPSRPIQERAEPILQKLAELKATLDDSLANLRRTRDLLLPRLLSGQVALSNPVPL